MKAKKSKNFRGGKKILVFLSLAAFFFAAAALYRPPQNSAESAAPAEERAVEADLFVLSTAATAVLRAEAENTANITVRAPLPGIVGEIFVRPGEKVYRGKRLLFLAQNYDGYAPEKTQAVHSAKIAGLSEEIKRKTLANLDLAGEKIPQVASEEARKSRREISIAKKTAKISAENAAAAAAAAAGALSLRYPTSLALASVEHIFVRRGDMVSAGEPLISLRAANGRLRLKIPLPSRWAKFLNTDARAFLLRDGEKIPLHLSHFPARVTRAGIYDLVFEPEEKSLHSPPEEGDFPRVEIPLRAEEGTVFAPLEAVSAFGGKTFLTVLGADGRAESREVEIRETIGSLVLIDGEVAAGEKVVVSGGIAPGEKVKIK